MSHGLTEDQIADLQASFDLFDIDGSGELILGQICWSGDTNTITRKTYDVIVSLGDMELYAFELSQVSIAHISST